MLPPTFDFGVLKSINLVFSIFIDNLLKTSHRSINFISDCMSWNRVNVFLWLVKTVVSSANIMALLKQLLKSFTYIRNRSGPKIDLCEKPMVDELFVDDKIPEHTTCCFLLSK